MDIDGNEITGISPSGFWETDNVDLSSAFVSESGYVFFGWRESLTDTSIVTGWEAGTRIANVTLYASKAKAADYISSLEDGATAVIKGNLTNYTLAILNAAIYNSGHKIALDLSGTTGLTEIPNQRFRGNKNLSGIVLPDSVKSIEFYAFFDCTSLSSITIPSSVTSIGSYAFCGCTSLSSVTIPDSVTSIGDYAFYGCTSLSSVTIPDSVTSIGWCTFYGCTSLSSVTFKDTSGWYCKNTFGHTYSVTDLADTSKAATYLTSEYCDRYWYKN